MVKSNSRTPDARHSKMRRGVGRFATIACGSLCSLGEPKALATGIWQGGLDDRHVEIEQAERSPGDLPERACNRDNQLQQYKAAEIHNLAKLFNPADLHVTDRKSIQLAAGPVVGAVTPPGSKSITNRALVCAALADGTTTLSGVLRSDDTGVMIACLEDLGIKVAVDWSRHVVTVTGCGGRIPSNQADLHVGNSGTTIRFLTAMVATGNGQFALDGVPRMRERPIGDLLDVLASLGVGVQSHSPGGCPPVTVNTTGLRGGDVTVRGNISSQFLSGLMLAAPAAESSVNIRVEGQLVSRPYVEMTRRVMLAFGADVHVTEEQHFKILAPSPYVATEYAIEPDASAASYFWAVAAITRGQVTVEGLSKDSLQGDVAFCECLEKMGCDVDYGSSSITVTGAPLRGIDVDMNDISDTVQTLAAVAVFAKGPTTIRGVAHIRHKETDRIGDLVTELRKLGARAREKEDGLQIIPNALHGAEIETYDDHRMAMSLSLVGLRVPNVVILNPGCAAKTYPGFFDDLECLASR